MKLRHLMLSSVLAIPALLLPLASCDDSKSAPTEPTATDPSSDGIDAPSLTTVGFGSKWHDPAYQGREDPHLLRNSGRWWMYRRD